MKKPIGAALDQLGIQISLDEGDLITSAVVIAYVEKADGCERVAKAWNGGCSFVLRRGLLAIANDEEGTTDEDWQNDGGPP